MEEGTGKHYLEFLPNRKIETLTKYIQENVREGTTIKTDGYTSYPKAVSSNNCIHLVVPHINGFKNAQGHTTNTIEGLWAILKSEQSKRKGVSKLVLELFIYEFMFRKHYINNENPTTWQEGIDSILRNSVLNE